MDNSTNYRLPRNTVPKRYSLRVRPDFDNFTFSGTESIDIEVSQPSDTITLNSVDLEIESVRLSNSAGTFEGSIQLENENERVIFSFPEQIPVGNATLELSFKGFLNDQLSGFYKSRFDTADGEPKYLATTQFEATDARKAFPCYDEPDLKAVFGISIETPRDFLAVSNAPEESTTELDDGHKLVRFRDTIPMSTYLVAMIIGPLEASEVKMGSGVPIRIISKPNQQHLHSFAQQVAIHALEFFSSWFSIPYPGEKLDLIAIPDFAFGAMENLGAVTFRETLLLVDPDKSSRIELERIVDVICHEIAHMWFGDLVTMKWWNGLWLNEAFATFMELLATDAYNPSWKRWVSFGLSKSAALAIDGLHNTRSIEFKVEKPSDAEGMFDVLTYEKGASVLRMLERYLGQDTFRSGITNYLNSHKYANAETTDLWSALEESSGEPISQTMIDWVFQGGHPLITAELDGDEVKVTQKPFSYLDPQSYKGSESMVGTSWRVPLSIRIGENVQRTLLDSEPLRLRLASQEDLVIVNAGGWGFFRASYDQQLLQRLLDNFAELEDLEKFNLASDIWALVLSQKLEVANFFDLLEAIAPETDPSLWDLMISALSVMELIFEGEKREFLATKCQQILLPLLEKIGFEAKTDEPEGTSRLRASVIAALGTIGKHLDTIAECKELFVREMSIEQDIDPDIISAVLKVVAFNGDEADFAFMLDRYRHPSTPQEENRYLMALTHFREPELINKVLRMTLDDIRSQNGPFVIASLLTGKSSGPLAWEFLKANWDSLLERFPDNTISRMLSGVTALISEESHLLADEINGFFKSHQIPSGEKSLQQTLERYQVNLEFRKKLLSFSMG